MNRVPTVSVHLLPALIPEGALDGGVAVVVDVLRATTVMVHALHSGCEAIVPCLEIDEARRVAAAMPAGSFLLAGERQGVPIEGFDLGNSPDDFSPGRCRGKTLVMTTTNGTRAILASTQAERVLIGAFVNLDAVRRALLADGRDVHVVCAGTDGLVSLEDSLLAGALVCALGRSGIVPGNDPARMMAIAWEAIGADRPAAHAGGLASVLATGRGGRRVTELGFQDDLADASRVDRFDLVPELHRDPTRIRAAGATDGPRIG